MAVSTEISKESLRGQAEICRLSYHRGSSVGNVQYSYRNEGAPGTLERYNHKQGAVPALENCRHWSSARDSSYVGFDQLSHGGVASEPCGFTSYHSMYRMLDQNLRFTVCPAGLSLALGWLFPSVFLLFGTALFILFMFHHCILQANNLCFFFFKALHLDGIFFKSQKRL